MDKQIRRRDTNSEEHSFVIHNLNFFFILSLTNDTRFDSFNKRSSNVVKIDDNFSLDVFPFTPGRSLIMYSVCGIRFCRCG